MRASRRSNTLRIIAGEQGGRKLRFPQVKGLRPTADSVRETLFNWLQAEIAGSHCLDLYAGSGALGFEALSRGAARVLMNDSASAVVSRLRENAVVLQVAERCEIRQQRGFDLLRGSPAYPFDLVFCDPPFTAGLMQRSCVMLESGGWLSESAFIYLEQDSAHSWPELPANWALHRHGQAGQAAFRLMRRRQPA